MSTSHGPCRPTPKCVHAVSVIVLFVALTACSGGGGQPSTQNPVQPPSQAVSVIITNAPAGVNAGTSFQFTANVLHTTNTAVSWLVTCELSPGCDQSAIGSIDNNGVFTAAASVSTPISLAVMATSVADMHASDQRFFTLMPPLGIAVSPTNAQVVFGFPYDFAAAVQNDLDNRGVRWAVNGTIGGNAQVGTITAQGRYTAPSSGSAATITAISVSDKNKSASTMISLISNPHPGFSGKYTFSFSAPDGLSLTAAAGTLNLDGVGHVSATVDINSGAASAFLPGVAMTGIYGFEDNNVGSGKLTYTNAQQSISIPFRFVLVSNELARMIQFDAAGKGEGTIERQAASGLTTSLDGDRVFSLTGLSRTSGNYTPVAFLGTATGTGGTLNGIYDTAGYDQTPFTGTYSFGNANSLTLDVGQWNANQPINFRVYPVSPNKAFLMSTPDPNRPMILTGIVEKQVGRPFSPASFAGNWVFSLQYANGNYYLAKSVLARVSSDGSGTDTVSGSMDHNGMYGVWDGPAYAISFTQYHVADNGRGNANAQLAQPKPLVWYWVTPQRGYIMCDDPYDTGIGEFFLQQQTTFDLSSLSGSLSVMLPGYRDVWTNNATPDFHVGTGTADGAGNFTLITSDVDSSDPMNPLKVAVARSGSYSFANDVNGRGLIYLDNGDFVLRFYAVSGSKLLLMRPAYDVINAGTAEQPSF
ncbi:MAG TPA: hypothetical protein VFJ47_04230 [Terriglobales bacterium]|nr:hypothetical protein [Terriglobales bacterium]